MRARLGRQARALAEAEFAEDIVVGRTLDLYRALLPGQLEAARPLESAAGS